MEEILTAERDIQRALVRYARALDTRDWALLDTVFDAHVKASYGDEPETHGRADLVTHISKFLGGCGPSQHLLGNFDVTVDGAMATSACYIRVFHQGKGDRAHLTQETFGTYHATWAHTHAGWRAVRWRLDVTMQLGTWEAFGL